MNIADDAAPPNRNITLVSIVIVKMPGMITIGAAANPDAKEMITGMSGEMIRTKHPVHAPAKLIGKRGPPMNPKH